jgi:hypothetical protein
MASTKTYSPQTLKALGSVVGKDFSKQQTGTEYFISTLGLKGHTYLVDQCQAYLVENFPFQGKDTFKGLAQDAVALGSYCFLKHAVGSLLVAKQTEKPEYSAFVPLVLQGYKKFSSVKYSQWPTPLVHVGEALGSALKLVQYTEDVVSVLEERNSLLEGTRYNSLKTLARPKGSVDFNNQYANCMYYQVWLAHPEIRHPDMYLDINNPDTLPEAYVKEESVLQQQDQDFLKQLELAVQEAKKTVAKEPVSEIPPWEQ